MPDQVETAERADWAADTADTIVRAVDTVRRATADRLVGVGRLLVYGLLAVVLASTAALLAVIGVIRLVDVYLPFSHNRARAVWVGDAAAGGMFTLVGLFLWSRRRPRRR